MFGRIFTILLLVGVIALAIMFDWFGAQGLFKDGVQKANQTVEELSDAGDKIKKSLR